jgi:DNA mismatch endonuclease (patch repair protein)
MADNMTPAQRSRTMSRIRSTDTKPEVLVRKLVFARGLRFRKCCRELPGSPDLVFASARLVVFVDGDFWHGWRFNKWEHKLSSDYWRLKIRRNRERDKRNQKVLRQRGWRVIRLWEHQIKADPNRCIDRIAAAVREAATPTRLPAASGLRPSRSRPHLIAKRNKPRQPIEISRG